MKTVINYVCQFVALSVLCLFWLTMDTAYAQALPSGGFPASVVGPKTTFGPAVASSANAASFTFAPAANGVYASSGHSIGLGNGRTASVVARVIPSAAEVAKAVAKRAFFPVAVVGVGVAAWDLAKELGYDLSYDSATASMKLNLVTPGCVQQYRAGSVGSWECTVQAACASVGATYYPTSGGVCSKPGANYSIQQRNVTNPPPTITPKTQEQYEADIRNRYPNGWDSSSNIGRAVADAVANGESVALPSPSSVTGPTSQSGIPSVVTRPDGSTVTSTPETTFDYGPDSVTVGEKTTTVERDANGNPVSTSTATKPIDVQQPQAPQNPASAPSIEVCGLPGKAPCKIDETGTPAAEPEAKYQAKVDELKTTVDSNRGVIAGSADKPFFQGWGVFFDAPAFVTCSPIPLPDFKGAAMGSINACPVVDGMRTVMGYIWAIGGMFMCVGMVRKVV